MAQPHSGWMNRSASGLAAARSASSAPLMPACTWHSPAQMCRFSRPAHAAHVRAEELVRAEQHLAVGRDRRPPRRPRSTTCSRCPSRPSPRRWCSRRTPRPRRGARPSSPAARRAVIESASEQPARSSGMSTVLSGARILAVSAMKCTPQNTIGWRVAAAAIRLSASESPVWSRDVLDLGQLVVVRQDHRVALRRPAAHLVRPRGVRLDPAVGPPRLGSDVRSDRIHDPSFDTRAAFWPTG